MSDFMDLFHDSMWALSVILWGTIHALHKPGFCQSVLEVVGQKLDTAIAVEKRARLRFAMANGRRQCSTGEAGGPLRSQRPSEQSARIAIHDGGQIAPRPRNLQVRHVSDPDLIRPIDRQLVDVVVDTGEEPAQAGKPSIEVGRASPHRVIPHQTLNPASSGRLALSLQRGMHARAAVGLPAVAMHLTDSVE